MRYHATGLLLLTLLWSCVSAMASAHTVQEGNGFKWTILPVDDPGQPEFGLWYDWVKENKRIHQSGVSDTNIIAPAGDYYVRPLIQGEGMELIVSGLCCPGDRWIDACRNRLTAGEDTRLEVVFALGASLLLSKALCPKIGWVAQVDLRHGLEKAGSPSACCRGERVPLPKSWISRAGFVPSCPASALP